MKKIFFVLLAILTVNNCFSQNKIIKKKIIEEIINDIKLGNIGSFYKTYPSYDTMLAIYLENGKEKQYNYIRSHIGIYKENERTHNKGILGAFIRFKGYYWDDIKDKNIRINWPEIEITDIILKDRVLINNDLYVINKHISTRILMLMTEKNSHKQYIADAETMFSISGKFISFYIENVYADFSSVKKYLSFKKEESKKTKMISVETIRVDSQINKINEIDTIEKNYGNEDEIAFTIKFVYEQRQHDLFLSKVIKVDNNQKAALREKLLYMFDTNKNITFSIDDRNNNLFWFMYQEADKIHVFSFDKDYSLNSLREFYLHEVKN